MADQGEKTEQPTQQRLKKSREEGRFPSARQFVSAMQFLVFVSLIGSHGADWIGHLRTNIVRILQSALDPKLPPQELVALCIEVVRNTMVPLAMLGAILITTTLASQMVVTRLGLSLKNLTPDFKRMNPLDKLRELPKRNFPALLQALAMIPVFSVAVYYAISGDFEGYLTLPLKSIPLGVAHLGSTVLGLLWKASTLFLVFGLVDLLRQKRRHQNELKMSKQDIKDEMKEAEGSPIMKQRIRRIRRDLLRRRMMHAVPTATAVVVNPTHYAVALKYDMNSRGAPKVVAKGKNYLALRIRKLALENQVPLIENPPLAQGLYKSAEVGQEIPAHFYRAVAEVLAYVFKVMNGRRPA